MDTFWWCRGPWNLSAAFIRGVLKIMVGPFCAVKDGFYSQKKNISRVDFLGRNVPFFGGGELSWTATKICFFIGKGHVNSPPQTGQFLQVIAREANEAKNPWKSMLGSDVCPIEIVPF